MVTSPLLGGWVGSISRDFKQCEWYADSELFLILLYHSLHMELPSGEEFDPSKQPHRGWLSKMIQIDEATAAELGREATYCDPQAAVIMYYLYCYIHNLKPYHLILRLMEE